MIEWAMLAALGFLAASLLALLLAPFLWRRAVHLTTLRVRSTLPLSLADIQADKDQLRAQFALSLRSIEVKLEQVEEKLALQRVESARAQQALREAESDIAGKQNLIIELEGEIANLKEQLLKSEEDAATHLRGLNEANHRLAEASKVHEEELARLHEMNLALDERRVELVALKTRLASADPALGVRIQNLLSQQNDERRNGPVEVETEPVVTTVNGTTAQAAQPTRRDDEQATVSAGKVDDRPEEETPKPLAKIKFGGEKSVAIAKAEGAPARKLVSLPMATPLEIKPKTTESEPAPRSASAASAQPQRTTPPASTAFSDGQKKRAATLAKAAAAPGKAASEKPKPDEKAEKSGAGNRKTAKNAEPAGVDPEIVSGLEALRKDLTEPQAGVTSGDMRKRLGDMTARLTQAAIEADGADGKLARLLDANQENGASAVAQPSAPISLAKVSSVAAARASTSLIDRIKAFDRSAKN